MALTKTSVNINFAKGLDTKNDPYQIESGKFLALNNMVRGYNGRFTKRNGFANITNLPNTAQTTLTTLNGNLLATGSSLYSYNQSNSQWLNHGLVQPMQLAVQTAVRTSTSQSSPDQAQASNGLACLVYMDSGIAYYTVLDGNTGQQVVARSSLGATTTCPRVVVLGNYFVISYMWSNSGTPNLAIRVINIATPSAINSAIQISSQLSNTSIAYDMISFSNVIYLAWTASDGSTKLKWIDTSFTPSTATTIASLQPTLISLTGDATNQQVWLTYYLTGAATVSSTAYSLKYGSITLAPTVVASSTGTLNALTALATAGHCTVFYETLNYYNSVGAYPTANIQTDFLSCGSITQAGAVTAPTIILRSVGLASKPIMAPSGTIYVMVDYGQVTSPSLSNQPSYFLIDSTGAIYMRLAYANGGGYEGNQVLANISNYNGGYVVPYLFKDFLATVNKGTNNPPGTPSNAIYTQTGINIAKFAINSSGQYSAEIASTLHLTGGQLWMYDGITPVEHGFHVWPENIQAVYSTTGGNQVAQPSGYVAGQAPYYAQFCYEWTDGQGNLHRSAPSIPVPITTSGTGSTGSTTYYVPTLRLTYKTGTNPVRIVGYRWSVAQQVYYQFTSITSPVLNDPTVDYVTIVDTNSDAAILGQTIIYTTGGVIEDIAAPASIASALYKNRLFLVDAEDPNLIWYSKQVIEAVPVEMSDLLTIYVAPTSGAQGSTGPITAISAMDDKLIVFKADAIYYITGTGPDNTGASNDFSDPIFITSAVGCANPNSIVLTPAGIMFQSDKGIWLLGRDLSTTYIGIDVQIYNSQTVASAQAIPGVNQVRFTLEDSMTLVYDYYYQQWGTFSNIQAVSSTLYQGYQTYLNVLGQVFQEAPNTYVDGSSPVLISLTTGWFNLAGLKGYERFYQMQLLGTYYTPFKLNVQMGYNYNSGLSQATIVTPDNQTPNWGGDANWGANPEWGGPGNVFSARVFPQIQKCESFQITITEIYDPSYNIAAGQGLSLSGITLVVGAKRGYSPQKASRSFG